MTRSLLWATAASLLASLGCGSEEPATPDEADYFPLLVGTNWVYDETRQDDTHVSLYKSITRCESIDFEDCSSGDPVHFDCAVQESVGSNDPEEDGLTYLVDGHVIDGITRVDRVRQEMVVDGTVEFIQTYSPGFLRFARSETEPGTSFEANHERCEEEVATGQVAREQKRYQWTIEGTEEVSVPAGDYAAALRIRRQNIDSGETKIYWFAPDVGKILEQEVDESDTVLRSEELTTAEMGTAPCAF